jgi:uncharacterized protein YndB with AHSA1/START domain
MSYPASTSRDSVYLGIGKQSSKGTGVTPTVFVPFTTESFDHGQDGSDVREGGLGPFVTRTVKEKHDPSGSFGLALRPKTFAQLAAWFLGADAIATVSGLTEHTATPLQAVTWLTLEEATGPSGDIIDRMVDVCLKSLTIKGEGAGEPIATVEWFGLTPGWQATAQTATFETGLSGVSPGAPYRQHETTYTVDGNAAANVSEYEISLKWNFDEDIRLSKVVRGHAVKLNMEGTVKVKQLLDGATAVQEYRKMMYGTTSGTAPTNYFFAGGFNVAYDNGLTSTNKRTLELSTPHVEWKKPKRTDLNPEGETFYIEREGTICKGTNPFAEIVSLTSDVAAY